MSQNVIRIIVQYIYGILHTVYGTTCTYVPHLLSLYSYMYMYMCITMVTCFPYFINVYITTHTHTHIT